MPTSFTAIDVETANADLASICQIGIVRFSDDEVQEQWQSLIDPEDEFDGINVSIHGIDETAVRGAPRFSEVAAQIASLLSGQVVVSHMAFDRMALSRVHEKYQIPGIQCRWLDSARVSRRAWVQFARQGYGLANIAAHCGIAFRHHDALEDARTAGQILLRAISDTGLTVEDWVTRAEQPVDPQGSRPRRSGNPDGELFGEVAVFTGALSMPRHEAADMAASAGCAVVEAVGKTVTLLVVGDQDVRRLGGQERSAKHRKAEAAIGKGQPIRILTERDFRALVGL